MKNELAPSGKLRVGLNYQNFLLVLGDGPDGQPRGIAPDLARELARRLGVPIEYVKFDAAGKLADGLTAGACDVGFLGAEPQRANLIAFTEAYLEIPVTFLVPAGSKIHSLSDIDQEGVRISVSERRVVMSSVCSPSFAVSSGGTVAEGDALVRWASCTL